MKIRTQFVITLSLFALVLLIILLSLFITNRQTDRLITQDAFASNIVRDASELSYLSNTYLIYHEPQQRARWDKKFASLTENISHLDPDTAARRIMVNNIAASQNRLIAVFEEAASALAGPALQDSAAELAFIRASWGRMQVQNQDMIFEAEVLSQDLRVEMDQLKRRTDVLFIALVGLFGAYLIVNYALIYRHTLRSISELQAGTRIIGSGRLDYAIRANAADEIGALAEAFNHMTANLKQVMASKADLEREVAVRERAEADFQDALHQIQKLNQDLQGQAEQLRIANTCLEQRAVDLEIANKELESFSYSVSHDLRTPLATIDALAQMLQEDDAHSPDARHHLNLIRAGTRQMEELIQSLLGLSRLTRHALKKQDVNMRELVAQAIDAVNHKPARSDLTLEISDLPDAQADPVLLKQVWVNLIANALKFTRHCAHPQIEIGCQACDGEDRVYYVRDNGVGFDMEQADRLFGVFQRLHCEEDFEGIGVGLALVQRIITRHGGRVWAEGEVGKGATFYFTL